MHLTLYYRFYCSLCHQMKAQLEALQQTYDFSFELVDVDADEKLEALFDELVPVLYWQNEEICHYHLDEDKLKKMLQNHPRRVK